MVHSIYSIAYCNIKLHNCLPLLLGPFRLPLGSVLALKEDQPFQSPFPAIFRNLGNSRVKPQAYLANNSEGSHFFHVHSSMAMNFVIFLMNTIIFTYYPMNFIIFRSYPMNIIKAQRLGVYGLNTTWRCFDVTVTIVYITYTHSSLLCPLFRGQPAQKKLPASKKTFFLEKLKQTKNPSSERSPAPMHPTCWLSEMEQTYLI